MVRKTSAAVEPHCRNRAATSKPVMPGIEISSTITSGWSLLAASSAAAPLVTDPTTMQPGVSARAERASIAALSSTSRTRGGSDDMVLDGILNQLRCRADLELFHHAVLVKRHGSRR